MADDYQGGAIDAENQPGAAPAQTSAANPARQNVWLDFLGNLAKNGLGGGGGNASNPVQGSYHTQSTQPNGAAQSAAVNTLGQAAGGGAGLAGCCG